MDPLQFMMQRQSFAPMYSSWVSIIVASCLVPFIYNLVSAQMNDLIVRIQRRIRDRINQYEYVLVYDSGMNNLYRYVSAFLDSKAEKAGVTKNASIHSPVEDAVKFGVEPGQPVEDRFEDVDVEWEFCVAETTTPVENGGNNKNHFQLRIRKQHRHLQSRYLLHVANTVIEMELRKKERSLFTCRDSMDPYWECYVFKHPATFDSLAMELGLKSRIMTDLKEFTCSKEYYESVGKPWKRGYLLHGPPGTGKSSLIAAIANYLSYDVYDLDLNTVKNNADLRRLLLQTTNKSVIVIEDIDCCFSSDFQDRSKKVSKAKKKKKGKNGEEKASDEGITLSGMLNFCDGLWSGSGSERVFIFTTNHVEILDPALLRKGRMDLHICMSYCKFEALKTLVSKYLKIEGHELLGKVEELLEPAKITPADIAEVLLSSRRDPTAALQNLISLLQEHINREVPAAAAAAGDQQPSMNGGVCVNESLQSSDEEEGSDEEEASDEEEGNKNVQTRISLRRTKRIQRMLQARMVSQTRR